MEDMDRLPEMSRHHYHQDRSPSRREKKPWSAQILFPRTIGRPPDPPPREKSSSRGSSPSREKPYRPPHRYQHASSITPTPSWSDVYEISNQVRQGPLQPYLAQATQLVCTSKKARGAAKDPVYGHGTALPSEPPQRAKEEKSNKYQCTGPVRKKIAAGLILVRTPAQTLQAKDPSGGRSEYQAIVVRGRVTYAFCEFVYGRYLQVTRPRGGERRLVPNIEGVRQLIMNMSIIERLTVETLDFDRIWALAWGATSARRFDWRPGVSSAFDRHQILHSKESSWQRDSESLYMRKRAEFMDCWLSSAAASKQLRTLLTEATGTGCTRWEFPKGKRLSSREPDISCAIREFKEEANIPSSAYRIVPGFSRVDMYMHMGVLYVNTYYLAILEHQIPDPSSRVSLRNLDQISEVCDVRWMGLEGMRQLRGPVGRDLTIMGRQAFNYARDHLKGKTQRRSFIPGLRRELELLSAAKRSPMAKSSRPPPLKRQGSRNPSPETDGRRGGSEEEPWQYVTHKRGKKSRKFIPDVPTK